VIGIGDVRAPSAPNLEAILEQAGFDGISGVQAARCLYRIDEPSGSQVKKVRRALNEMVEDGTAEIVGSTRTKKWRLSE
jgi:hypothetical protein